MSEPLPLSPAFDAIDTYIKAAREIMRDGHMPDMAGLDQRVARLCEAVTQAAPEYLPVYLARLRDLAQRLDDCAADLRAARPENPAGCS